MDKYDCFDRSYFTVNNTLQDSKEVYIFRSVFNSSAAASASKISGMILRPLNEEIILTEYIISCVVAFGNMEHKSAIVPVTKGAEMNACTTHLSISSFCRCASNIIQHALSFPNANANEIILCRAK